MVLGEVFLGAFLQVLLEKLSSPVLALFLRWLGPGNTRKTIEQWKSHLQTIEVVLSVAEQRQVDNDNIKAWLRDLKDLAHDMEDILDHFAIQAHASAPGEFGSAKDWVKRLSAVLNPISRVENQRLIDDINDRLQNIRTQMQDLNLISLQIFPQQTLQLEAVRQQRDSTSLATQVFGRRDKIDEIITRLLTDGQSITNYVVIPIVGKGGIGKTTLAQYAYNYQQHYFERVFDCKAWVCVSDVFDVQRITTTIINAVHDTSGTRSDFSNLNEAQEKLKEALMGKKFLIVLDDIWNVNDNGWDLLQRTFQGAAKGSRIIITTRDKNIAMKMMVNDSINNSIINIEVLSGDVCWRVFRQHAKDIADLAEMQDQIVEKCKGFPLAAIALAGLLNSTKDSRQRRNILESNLWSDDSEQNSVLPVLRLSYHHLPSPLKPIFAYCSAFPKDYIFQETEIVLQWMAQGFLPENPRKRMEDIGHDYFGELVSRSLFEPSQSSEEGFIMHDLIHDLALWAADDLCYSISTIHKPQVDLRRTRHVSIHATILRNQLSMASKLRSIYCLEDIKGIEDMDFILRFRYIRTLRLVSHDSEVLPKHIGNRKHLRFLHLNMRNLKESPKSMDNLWNLQTLWLEGCYKLQKLPNIRCLGNLRHLKIGRYSRLKEMPMGIGELTNLQSLDHFVLGDGGGVRIRDLKNLIYLQGELIISGLESVLRVEDAKEAQLDNKDGLEKLCLVWSAERDDVDVNTKRDVLEQLKPPSSIKQLKLERYMGLRFPNWLGNRCFSEMVGITLKDCDKCEYLPALGQLPSLKNLRIEGMDVIKEIGAEFYGFQNPSFPVLEDMSFGRMDSWEKWVHSSAQDGAFPCLKELSIESSSALKELSPHLPFLKRLKIKTCRGELSVSLERLPLLEVLEVDDCSSIQFTSGSSSVVRAAAFELAHLTILKISRCSGRISLPGGLLLPAVEHVSFNDCEDLGSLPRQLRNYFSLKKLTISNCNTMEEFPEGGFPANLEELAISVVVIKQQLPKLVVHHLHSLRSLELVNVPKLEDICVPSSYCHLSMKNLDNLKTISSSFTVSNLTSLEVEGCPSLVSLLPEDLLLSAVERLEVIDCENMERLPSQLHRYTSLKLLTISSCPKIKEIPRGGLPTNVKEIRIEHVSNLQEVGVHHLHSLRSLILKDVGMTREDLCIPSSLSTLTIWGILDGEHTLKSISSTATEDSKLTELRISDCPKFKSLVGKFTFLSHLRISKCPEFQFPTEGGLPGNLTHFELYGRMNGDKPIQEWGLHLLSSLQSLTLGELGSSTTEAVECIPSPNLLLPSSLSKLDISGFQNLKTINCSSFTNMNTLCIRRCPKFQSFGDLRQKLPQVVIDNCESLKPHLKVDPDGPIHEVGGCEYSLI